MTIFRLLDQPLATDATDATQLTTLDGREYSLRFIWNAREESWYFFLADQDESPIVSGRKMVPDWDLLKRVRDERRPPGPILLRDLTGNQRKPGLGDLGNEFQLYYFDQAEILDLLEEAA